MTLRRVGILGGMGPQATILLQHRLVAAVAAQDDQDHIPLLVDMNPQVPSRLSWLLDHEGDNPGPVLAQMAQGLARQGAQALAMPCNTAHHFVPDIQRSTDLPFLNMTVSATALAAQNAGVGGTVGILASPATQTTRLFHDALEAQGCSALYPDDQAPILAAIKATKIDGVTPASVNVLQQQADKLAKAGAQCILIGCSEFSLMSGDITSPVRLIDTLDVLVDQITAFSGATRRPH